MATVSEATLLLAPRTEEPLRQLPSSKRNQLFAALCKSAGSELKPGKKSFRRLSAAKQTQWLLKYLRQFDADVSGFVVEGVALPVRSRSEALNQRRMDTFAESIMIILNTFKQTGFATPAVTHLPEHGVLITAFRPPPQDGVAQMPPIRLATSEEGPLTMEALHVLHCLGNGLQEAHEKYDSVPEGVEKEIADSALKGVTAETMREVLQAIDAKVKEHQQVHGDDVECDFLQLWKRVQALVTSRLYQQLS